MSNALDNLAILSEPAPCETCRHADHCRETWEACLAFLEYTKGKPWDLMPKQPREDIGRRVFGKGRKPKAAIPG